MYRISAVIFPALLCILFAACSKESDPPTGIPRIKTPKLTINGPAEVTVQKYRDTVLVPYEFRSDSSKEIGVKNIVFVGTDNDLGVSVTSATGKTPFIDTVKIYAASSAHLSDYIRRMNVSYDNDSATKTILIHIVQNSNCDFLFTGVYSFKQLYPATAGSFSSTITSSGINSGTISNFANTGKSVQVTFNCGSELLNIPLQALDANTDVRGSGSWGANGLTINYTTITSAFTASGTIQGVR